MADTQSDERWARLRAWRLELLDPPPQIAPQFVDARASTQSPAHLAMERRITQVRWIGVALCALVAPFVGVEAHLPAFYACLAVIAGYNFAFSRLVDIGRPAWLLALYAY